MSGSTLNTSPTGLPTTKRCTKCLQHKPLSHFRRYWGRSSDGLRPTCVECQRRYEAQYRVNNRELLRRRRQLRAHKEQAYRLEYDARRRGHLLAMEAKRRCSRRNLPFNLDQHIPELEERMQLRICEMTGLPLNFYNKGTSWDSPSLHRVVPEKGYTYDNVKVVCFGMNAALGSWGEEALLTIVSAWWTRRP